ncbi:hypothetical protein VTK56DRAFT_857 [Thermocarpiscus australiensis]
MLLPGQEYTYATLPNLLRTPYIFAYDDLHWRWRKQPRAGEAEHTSRGYPARKQVLSSIITPPYPHQPAWQCMPPARLETHSV